MSYSIIWQDIQSSEGKKPPGRFGNAHARIGASSIVIHGGCSWKKGSRFTFLDDLWLMRILSPTEVQWEPLSQRGQLPGARAYHHLCVIGRKLFIFGGKSAHADRCVCPGIHVYDYMSRSWYRQHLEQEEEPASLGCSATVLEQQVFVFGGMTRGAVSSKTRVFQPSSSSWIVLDTSGAVPPPRCDHAAAVVNSSLYIHGGCAGPDLLLSDLYQLDTNTLVWTKIDQSSSLNIPRAGHSLTAHHSKDLYVFGGFNDVIYPDGGPITEDLCKFSIGQSRWKVPKPLPTGSAPSVTYHHSAYVIHSHLYIIGGLSLHGMANDIQVARLLSPSERQGTLMDDEDSAYDNIYDRPATALGDQTASRLGSRKTSQTKGVQEDAIIKLTTLPKPAESPDKNRRSHSLELNRKPNLRPQRAVEDAGLEPPTSQPRSSIDNGPGDEATDRETGRPAEGDPAATRADRRLDMVTYGPRRVLDVVDTPKRDLEIDTPERSFDVQTSVTAAPEEHHSTSEEKEDNRRMQAHSATFRNRLDGRGGSSDDNSQQSDELEKTLRPPRVARRTGPASSSSTSSAGTEMRPSMDLVDCEQPQEPGRSEGSEETKAAVVGEPESTSVDHLNTGQFDPDFGESRAHAELSEDSSSVASVVAPRTDIFHGTSKQISIGGDGHDSPIIDVEVDNGNDDADTSSEENALNTAERQQLELLTQDSPNDTSFKAF